MADLRPCPFPVLVSRMLSELESEDSVFDLPRAKFFLGDPERDLSVRFHGRRASSPFGPAAGPQSQMAQNLVLAWLGGARIIELKTVQVLDELQIPRPCIDARTVGFNVEWSQELMLRESLREYLKGAMLVEILKASGMIDLAPGFGDTVWDMSVGYDLDGIRSDGVQDFIRGMTNTARQVGLLRDELRGEWPDLKLPRRLSGTLTLSTFHGCPPDEIERILEWLMREHRLDVVVKLNPTLLGPETARGLLHDELGYTDLSIPDRAFESDTKWEQATEFVERLGFTAARLGLGFGVKFTNTLIVENRGGFLPAAEKESYLSGQPLHVLAVNLVRRFRERFGTRFPISFSAGIDRGNFADAVALGLVPVTVCTDLLRPGGYARASSYLASLSSRMAEGGAHDVDEWIVRAFGHGAEALERATKPETAARTAGEAALAAGAGAGAGALRAAVGETAMARWVAEAVLLNTETYAERATADPRYGHERNSKPPRKMGTRLDLFDCLTCDKCIPVCPNAANFILEMTDRPIPIVKVRRNDAGAWVVTERGEIQLEKKHQIGNFIDFCNECGNCDVFCPEDGGPYVLKPRFFGSEAAFEAETSTDGFWVGELGEAREIRMRRDGLEYSAEAAGDGSPIRYRGPGFDVIVRPGDPVEPGDSVEPCRGEGEGEIDLTWAHVMVRLADALLRDGPRNWVRDYVRPRDP